MKNPDKFRKNIDGSWYYKCNCCQQWKVETEFGCDNYCKSRHGHTTRCKQCLHIINHYDKGYKSFHISPFKNDQLYLEITSMHKIEMVKIIYVKPVKMIGLNDIIQN